MSRLGNNENTSILTVKDCKVAITKTGKVILVDYINPPDLKCDFFHDVLGGDEMLYDLQEFEPGFYIVDIQCNSYKYWTDCGYEYDMDIDCVNWKPGLPKKFNRKSFIYNY
jgi:hypothetical protein